MKIEFDNVLNSIKKGLENTKLKLKNPYKKLDSYMKKVKIGENLSLKTKNSDYILTKLENGNFKLETTTNPRFKHLEGTEFKIKNVEGNIFLQNGENSINLSKLDDVGLIKKVELKNSYGDKQKYQKEKPVKPIKENQNLGEKIVKIKNEKYLLSLLSKIDGLDSNSGHFTSQELIQLVKDVISGKKESTYLPRTHGLRNKVNEIINFEKVSQDYILKKLWPKGLTYITKQGSIGDCYFIAGLNAIKEHKDGYSLLKSMIRPTGNGEYIVKFKGLNSEITIKPRDLEEYKRVMGDKRVNGQPGDDILEVAYMRLRKNIDKGNNVRNTNIKKTGDTVYYKNKEGDFAHVGGYPEDVFVHFFGDEVKNTRYPLYSNSNKKGLKDGILYHLEIEKNKLVTAISPYPLKILNRLEIYYPNRTKDELAKIKIKIQDIIARKKDDSVTFKITDINGTARDFHANHAYSIGEYNKEKGWIEVVNPHNSIEKRYKISIDDFIKYFNNLVITEFTTPNKLKKAI